MPRPYTVILIIPTGIGAAIGGYAGDGLPVARAIAQVADPLITHPNVLNGAQLYWPIPNSLYVEGYALDQFAAGTWGLQTVHQNRVGLLLDQAIEPELRLRHLQVADAARATLGLSLTDYVITDAPLNVELRTSESGASWGTIGNPDSLLRAAERLITEAKAEAIAVVARFPEAENSSVLEAYRHGQGVDPLAGAEAVISHLIVRTFQIPCAHAPALSPLPLDPELSPRSAAEELGYTFLPCVLVGLSRAPQFVTSATSGTIWADQVDAVVVPATACGGSAILSLSRRDAPRNAPRDAPRNAPRNAPRDAPWRVSTPQIITVGENKTRMQVTPERLGIQAVQVNSYLEALGILVAHKAGVDPNALRPNLLSLRQLKYY
ncbi:DUF3326 domain-containing protein [Planktothrix sp. FACHB-1365]|uniref:DUF3326 domain-containing protein n=1 Tax=Planktothrix sp. FACHB-1365 TaxID=2692855 RepID=UPI00168907D4|nr:DUF3326 domain-containing protein [Planktothrix sp. FACHB-1365]